MDATTPHRLHHLLMDLVQAGGLLHADQVVPGQQVSLSQAFALHELDVDGPLSQGELAGRLRLEKSSASRMAADLERKGWLVREREPANRRLYRLRLTDAGRAMHARIGAEFHQSYVRWVAALTPDECDALFVGLSALVRTMRAERPLGARA